nr:DUF2341 domain-containing protein [Candidatus Sigynarchaeota archaeon]
MTLKKSTACKTLVILGFFLVGSAIIFPASHSNRDLQEDGSRFAISNSAYTYAIQISPITPANDYTIRLDLNSSFDYGACKVNGDDVRFYDLNDNSLSYWIEIWNNAGTSTIWVKIPQAGTSEIHMSYGDSLAPAASNGDATFVFFDHFTGTGIDTASKWNIYTDTYSSVTQTSGTYAYLASIPPTKERSAIFIGFNDYYLSGGVIVQQNGAYWDGDYFKNRRSGGTYQQTAFNAVNQWRTFDVCWISSSMIKYFTNDILKATHTSGIPTTSIPISIWASTIYSSTGSRYAGYLRSKDSTLGQAGYAFRYLSWADYDYSAYGVYAQVKVDWCFVRKCTSNEPIATLNLQSTPPVVVPVVYGLPFSEGFEWGNIPAVNTISNTFERIKDASLMYAGWDAKEYSSSGGLLLANNFVNTMLSGDSTVLHMENHDDSSSGFHHSQVQVLIDAHAFLNNLILSCKVQGNRNDGSSDNSAAAIYVIEDTNNDGLFEIGGSDFLLAYVMDFDGIVDSEGIIDHFKSNKIVDAWVPISTDWDGSTWYDVQSNISDDWSHYMGWAMNKTNLAVVLANSQRIDTSSTSYYMWSNWDNFTLGTVSAPDFSPPTITINSPANAVVLGSNMVSLNVNVVDAHLDHVWYKLDNGPAVNMPSNASFSAANGNHALTVYANDTAGNLGLKSVVFIVTSSPPQVDIFVIVITIIISAGVVVSISYRQHSKKIKVQGKVPRKKSNSSLPYANAVDQNDKAKLESLKKRQRLMTISDRSGAESRISNLPKMPDETAGQKAMKKNGANQAEVVDLDRRVKNAAEMQSEVSVQPIVARCLVHKGEISGLNYKCDACGATYCIDCARHLAETNESCWNCNTPLPKKILETSK